MKDELSREVLRPYGRVSAYRKLLYGDDRTWWQRVCDWLAWGWR